MKKRMLKGVSLLAIAVLLITQAGATQILEAEEAVLAEPTTELGVPYSEIPLELTPAMLDERNHVRRVRDEEVQENMAVFENADGTRTAYLFAEDIWYEDENGEKQDYGKELITSNETGIAYRTENGSGELKLPSTLTANTPVQYEQNGLKITMAPTLDRVVSVPLPAVEAETAIELPGQTWDGTIGEPANAGATESEATQPPIMENTVEEEDNTAMTTAQAPATGTGAPLQADAIAEAAGAALGGKASVTNTAEPAGQNDDTTAGTSGSAALQESSAAQESAAETESAALTETAEASAASEEALLEEMPVVSEPVYSRMADNTIVTVDASRNLLEQVGDQLLGARRASLQEAVSQESGRTEDLVSYSRAFVDAAVEYKCVPLLHGFKNEIVLNSAGRANTYSFVTDFDGLTPRDSTGYAIPLEDENGEVVTYLALEELMDAAGNYSMENVIDIAQYENGQYLVTITLDEAFLADEDTVYPVTASASSTGWLYHTSMDDTHIMQSVPTTNYYGATVMYMGRWASYPARIMMQFVFTDALKNAINPTSYNRSKAVFVGPVNGYDEKRWSTSVFHGIYGQRQPLLGITIRGYYDSRHGMGLPVPARTYNFGRSRLVGIPVYAGFSLCHAAELSGYDACRGHCMKSAEL